MARQVKVGDRVNWMPKSGRRWDLWQNCEVIEILVTGSLKVKNTNGVEGRLPRDKWEFSEPPEPVMLVALNPNTPSSVGRQGQTQLTVILSTEDNFNGCINSGRFANDAKFYRLVPVEIEEVTEQVTVTKKRIKQ